MKIGDRVIIKNVSNAWDKNVYFSGWSLSAYIMWKDKNPNVTFYNLLDGDEKVELENGMVGVLEKPFGEESDRLMISLDFLDDRGEIAKCHSQNYTIEELQEIVKIVDEDCFEITVSPIGQRVSSENFTVEVYEDEMYVNDYFTIASDAEIIDELIEVLNKTKENLKEEIIYE